jgi:ABC-2 type transport system permease protein
MRLLLSGIRKLSRRPVTFVTFGLLVGLVAFILLAVGTTANQPRPNEAGTQAAVRELLTFPGAYNRMLQLILGLGGLFAVIYGAAIAGSEWSWGTFKSAVARGESRVGYILSTFASIAVMVLIGMLIAYAISVVAAVVAANLAGISTSGLSDTATLGGLPVDLVKGWVGIMETAAIGFAIATLARSQLAGIGVGIAFYFGESFASIFLPDIVKYMPFSVASAAVSTGSTGAEAAARALPADQALVLVVVWLVGSLVVAAVFSNRAEITG